MATEEELQALEAASDASAAAASTKLNASLLTVRSCVARIEDLKPKNGVDEVTYQKLIALIQDATRKNESIAMLRANVQSLGSSAVALVNDMAKIAGKLV